MKQRLQHAIVREALRSITRETLSEELDEALKDLTLPPNHRLHLLARSIAWHQKRQRPELRLRELAGELARLWQHVENQQERRLYLLLINNLGLWDELAALCSSLQQGIDRIAREYNTLDAARKSAPNKEEERRYRTAMRHQQQQRAVQETNLQVYQQVIEAVNKSQPTQQQQQPSWVDRALQRVQNANEQTARPYNLSDEERTHLRPQIRLRLALAAVQLIQTARRREQVRQMVQQIGQERKKPQPETEHAA